jgi:hypothetical protein
MNRLHIGFSKTVELPKGGFLFIDDEAREIPRARVFNPLVHCFNPLKDIDHKRARQLAALLYTLAPEGESTLTVRNGRRALFKALLDADRLDRVKGDEEVQGMIDDILGSPVLRRVLCNPTNFSFNPRSMIFARLNRAELGDFDALVLGILLMSHFKGQLIVPDLGFYGRDMHVSLIREERLIAGVNFLEELPDKLRPSCLLIKDKRLSGATVEDAETTARLMGLAKGTTGFNDFVKEATE